MEKKPLIRQGWVRVLIFVIVLITITLFLTWLASAIFTGKTVAGNSAANVEGINQQTVLISLLFSFITSITIVFLFRKRIDRQSLKSLGMHFNGHLHHAATGFFLGIFLLGVASLLLVANKNLSWTGFAFDATQLFTGLILMALVACTEELVFRGYVLNNLMQSMNKWIALTFSALLFALFHSSNPDISLLALLNIFLSGLLLGINYIFTKNLWFAIFLHFSWNFYQGYILGYNVSGLNVQSMLQQALSGSPLLTGGNFGLEGSVIVSLLSMISTLTLGWFYRKQFRPQYIKNA